MNAPEVLIALSKKYKAPEWAFFDEVRNSTGFARKPRTADAIAFNTWPSRGLELHGFEIKVYRSDWLRELKNPRKAEEGLLPYCDQWWVVTGEKDIVKPDELPKTWGLMVPKGKAGKTLKIKTAAPKLEPQPLDRRFLASLMRQIYNKKRLPEEIQAKIDDAFDKGEKLGQREMTYSLEQAEASQARAERHLKELEEQLSEFEKASGQKFVSYSARNGKKLGDAVRVVLDAKLTMSRLKEAEQARMVFRNALHSLERTCQELKALAKERDDA